MTRWPDPVLRVALWVYEALWIILIPLVWLYLRKRGRRDPLYAHHISERFGHAKTPVTGAIWVHAVSLGEMRSATPQDNYKPFGCHSRHAALTAAF